MIYPGSLPVLLSSPTRTAMWRMMLVMRQLIKRRKNENLTYSALHDHHHRDCNCWNSYKLSPLSSSPPPFGVKPQLNYTQLDYLKYNHSTVFSSIARTYLDFLVLVKSVFWIATCISVIVIPICITMMVIVIPHLQPQICNFSPF